MQINLLVYSCSLHAAASSTPSRQNQAAASHARGSISDPVAAAPPRDGHADRAPIRRLSAFRAPPPFSHLPELGAHKFPTSPLLFILH